MSIRVLVADDQMIRAGFRMLLANEPDIEVVAEANNGLDAVAQVARVLLATTAMLELAFLGGQPAGGAPPHPERDRPRGSTERSTSSSRSVSCSSSRGGVGGRRG